MRIYTGQVGKCECLDTTIKSGVGKFGKALAPTWELVGGVKNFECDGKDSGWKKFKPLTYEQYTAGYTKLMIARFNADPTPFLILAETKETTIGCYCSPGRFCHRLLITDIFFRIVQLCRRVANEPELETAMRKRFKINRTTAEVDAIIEQMKRVQFINVEYMGEIGQPTPPTVPAQEVNNITEVKGDLFADKQAAILHGVNCKGVAGRGFVLALKQAYPTALVKYTAYGKAGQLQPGGLVVYERKSEPLILHAATQDGYGAGQRNAKTEWIESALELAIVELDKRGITQLAMPRIAAGLGGMDWEREVKPIIVRVFAKWRGHVTIYSL